MSALPNRNPQKAIGLDAIGDAWRMVISDWAPWLVGSGLLISCTVACSQFVKYIVGSDGGAKPGTGETIGIGFFIPPGSLPLALLCMSPFILIAGALGVGLQRVGLIGLQGARARIEEAFGLNGRAFEVGCWHMLITLFWALVMAGASVGVSGFVRLGGETYRTGVFWPGLVLLIFLPAVICLVQAPFMLVPLLIVEEGMSIGRAMKISAERLSGQFHIVAVVSLLASIVAWSGGIACCLGIVFSLPIAFAVVSVIYERVLPRLT